MLGSELRAMRKAAGYKANRLAAAMDIAVATLSKYEHGHAPVPKKVELAARYLCEVPPDTRDPAVRLVDAIKDLTQGGASV